jgi:hypothetical protein
MATKKTDPIDDARVTLNGVDVGTIRTLGSRMSAMKREQLRIDGAHQPDVYVLRLSGAIDLEGTNGETMFRLLQMGRPVRITLTPVGAENVVLQLVGEVAAVNAKRLPPNDKHDELYVQERGVKAGMAGRLVIDGEIIDPVTGHRTLLDEPGAA